MATRIIEMRLPNGATALVRAADVDGADESGGATKTRFTDAFDFGGVADTLEGLSSSIRSALTKAAPDRVRVELALELAVKNGKLTGLLVEGEGKGSLTVSLEWGPGGAD
ncbi:MAG TPA: CU044_2847 family protein [Solirubrobacteraceae bacterium]|nr:CU044_2847 family protein [Solirubrobacteraceae bacterium]